MAGIKAEFAAPMTVVATGGLAALYAKACPCIEHLEPDLTIYGLRGLYELNRLNVHCDCLALRHQVKTCHDL